MRIGRVLLPLLALSSLPAAPASRDTKTFPPLYNTERNPVAAPMPPAAAAAGFKLPPGFKATVFAAEPDVQNPIALAWDGRGRLWIAENFTYAESPRNFDLGLRDRVLIFDDRNGDGRFDSRTVFTENVQMLTSLELGHGGVWLMCPPRLLFMPDRDRNDIPDAPPEVVLDGFHTSAENHHTFANGLRWGPDGWLYGRCGASSAGRVGVPGTAEAARVPVRGGLWRFHPRTKAFETLTHGTTNPWGHDWDAHGELFYVNTVNGHLWHAIPGAHCTRSATIDPNPHVYALLDQHGDHYHFDTGKGLRDATAADGLGGGHVHVGMMIYQGDNWPAEYRGRLFTLNFHGRRANQDILERRGSGYVGKHAPDFFLAADPWFRGQEISCGPDGGVIVLDWSDIGECHENDGVHRTSGRIFKITYGESSRSAAARSRCARCARAGEVTSAFERMVRAPGTADPDRPRRQRAEPRTRTRGIAADVRPERRSRSQTSRALDALLPSARRTTGSSPPSSIIPTNTCAPGRFDCWSTIGRSIPSTVRYPHRPQPRESQSRRYA